MDSGRPGSTPEESAAGSPPPPPPPARAATITRLEPDPVRPGAVRIYADGQRFCSVGLDLAERAALHVGRSIDRELEDLLARGADDEAAFRTALAALARRGFARSELGARLRRKGHSAPAVDAALERAAGLGLLDDAAFARRFCEVHSEKGKGPVRLLADLRRMGVDQTLIQEALDHVFPPGADHSERLRGLAAKRARQLSHLPRAVQRRRLLAFLARRGYRGHAVIDMVRELVSTQGSAEPRT